MPTDDLSDLLTERLGWGDAEDPLFHEYVAREHLEGGMPLVELHRNHGVPLSAVKRWIATFQQEGRAGLERKAAAARAKKVALHARLEKKVAAPEELEALAADVASGDLPRMRAAYGLIGKRRLLACVPAVVQAIRTKPEGRSVQDELELLAELGARAALHELFEEKSTRLEGYKHWRASLMKRAGCALRRDASGVHEYELDGRWFRVS